MGEQRRCDEIQKFAGDLQGKRAKKGVFITTSAFTTSAKEYVTYIELERKTKEVIRMAQQSNIDEDEMSTIESASCYG